LDWGLTINPPTPEGSRHCPVIQLGSRAKPPYAEGFWHLNSYGLMLMNYIVQTAKVKMDIWMNAVNITLIPL